MITESGIRNALTSKDFHNISIRNDEAGWAVLATSKNANRVEFHVYGSGQIEVRTRYNTMNRGQHSLWAADQVDLSAVLTTIAAL